MRFFRDTKGQLALEWSHAPGNGMNKRAWIQHREPESPEIWAGSGRYVIIASLKADGSPRQGPDFPVYVCRKTKTDTQVLLEVATALMAATGATTKFLDDDRTSPHETDGA